MKIDNLIAPLTGQKPAGGESPNLIRTLSNDFSKMLGEVNAMQLKADQKIEEFATTKDKDLHGTMIAMQKADVSLRLLLQIRSRLTTAYQEIMRMQL